jgi:hypothetical protein
LPKGLPKHSSADIGNLDELEEEGEDQNEDHTFCSKISEITTQLSNLDEEDECFGNPFGNPKPSTPPFKKVI